MAAPKFVLITGCSPGGLGYALAVEFHKRGCHVIATARKPEVLAELSRLGMSAVKLDVTSKESVLTAKEEVSQLTGGRLDILINNAGRSHTIPALDFELEDAKFTYETNVFGPMLMCQAFTSLLIPARGLIINISSASSVIPYLFGGVYSATKAALNQYSRVLRMELKPYNVRVMVVMAGTIRSNIASYIERELPSNSLYLPVQDMFERRKTFSQNNRTMPNEQFAARLVAQALKGEGWLGGWLGRTPDWYWLGGMSTPVWLATCMPRWMAEGATAIFWRIPSMIKRVKAAGAKRD